LKTTALEYGQQTVGGLVLFIRPCNTCLSWAVWYKSDNPVLVAWAKTAWSKHWHVGCCDPWTVIVQPTNAFSVPQGIDCITQSQKTLYK